ncbi:U4/U6.U5 tri-snRNP-associated protein 3 [Colletotrichum musicola]|uniref:U4/U6.U5 tri-snRNP-associated protein 3 n=1 Tax=Colletotrichum musicola TaxID=2175873 RepID=A0A8H6NJW2_9PEZI|nr:U4/U6.U5 tri-snRNP-associated protein 3 [Colletotrichum musicola]
MGRDNRGGWGEPDRRSRHGGGPRDGDREGYRDRDRDSRRDNRDRRGDDRDRRYRSRSRERRDRDHRPRDRDRERDRPRDDRDGRAPRRDRDGRPDRDDRRRRDDDRDDDRPPRRHDADDEAPRKFGLNHSSSPRSRANDTCPDAPPKDRRRSASPRRDEGKYTETLPTRSALGRGRKEQQQHTMSFKVGRHDSPQVDSGRDSESHGDTPMTGGRDDGDDRREDDDDEDEPEIEVEDDGMAAMQAMMGFGGFGTTKNQKIAGNNVGAVRKEKKTEYRQYMNRQGGFNRPLSPSR